MGEEIKIVLARAMLNSLCKFGADKIIMMLDQTRSVLNQGTSSRILLNNHL